MRHQRGFIVELLLVLVAIVLWVAAEIYSCSARWADSGLRSSWGIMKGCVVQTASGRWIPDDRIRDIDIAPADAKASGVPK